MDNQIIPNSFVWYGVACMAAAHTRGAAQALYVHTTRNVLVRPVRLPLSCTPVLARHNLWLPA